MGDYIPADAFISDDLVPRFKTEAPNFAGFALQDVSYDVLNKPCYNDSYTVKRTYSDVLYTQLTLPVSQAGNKTTGKDDCLPTPVVTRTTTTTTTATKTTIRSAGTISVDSAARSRPEPNMGLTALAIFVQLLMQFM
jgi:hypothetical protein